MTITTQVQRQEGIERPHAFNRNDLGWVPWLQPSTSDELTDRQVEALVQASRAANPYFRLLADDPDILEARTRADLEIFHSSATAPPTGCVSVATRWSTFASVTCRPDHCCGDNSITRGSRRRPPLWQPPTR